MDDGENSGFQEFEWQIPHNAIDGIYRVGIQLRNAYNFDSAVYSAIDYTASDAITFNVLEGPLIEVSPKVVQFGTISDPSSQEAQHDILGNEYRQADAGMAGYIRTGLGGTHKPARIRNGRWRDNAASQGRRYAGQLLERDDNRL